MATMDGPADSIKAWTKPAYETHELIQFVHKDRKGRPYLAITLTCAYGEEDSQWAGECIELGMSAFASTFEQMWLELNEAVELELTEAARLSSSQEYLAFLTEREVAIAPLDISEAIGIDNTMVQDELSDIELEILCYAAAGKGESAGRIYWIPPDFEKTLHTWDVKFGFSFDSGRKDRYWYAVKDLAKFGYIADSGSGRYIMTEAGHRVAQLRCPEWRKRQREKFLADEERDKRHREALQGT